MLHETQVGGEEDKIGPERSPRKQAAGGRGRQQEQEGGEDAGEPADIEHRPEVRMVPFTQQNSRNQIPGQDEKEVDANPALPQAKQVMSEHKGYSDTAKSIERSQSPHL
jgi:hypothetical protein